MCGIHVVSETKQNKNMLTNKQNKTKPPSPQTHKQNYQIIINPNNTRPDEKKDRKKGRKKERKKNSERKDRQKERHRWLTVYCKTVFKEIMSCLGTLKNALSIVRLNFSRRETDQADR